MIKAYLDREKTKTNDIRILHAQVPVAPALSGGCGAFAGANGSGLRLVLFIGKAPQHQLPSSLV